MFDLIFDGLSAWNQLLLIFGGLILLAIGGAILGDFVYWRLKAQRVKGKIVGVRAQISKFNKEEQKKEDPPEEELTSFAEEFKKSPGTGMIAVIFIVMMIGIPSTFVCIGTYFAYDYFALKASGVSVEAIVTGQDKSYDSESGTTYHALLRFTDEYGRQHNVRDRMGGGKPSYKINEKVIIYYERGDPEHFVTTDFWHNMILPVGFIGMGS